VTVPCLPKRQRRQGFRPWVLSPDENCQGFFIFQYATLFLLERLKANSISHAANCLYIEELVALETQSEI
jgi:hypothetical protein